MASRAWRASGAVRAPGRGPRPAGSWAASIARARAAWDELTGGPSELRPEASLASGLVYSDLAAAAILECAGLLWSDTAASMGEEGGVDDVA